MKKRLLRTLTITAAILVLSSNVLVAPADALSTSNALENHQAELPLGTPALSETRLVEQIAPGVTYTSIKRGFQSSQDYHTIDAGFFTEKSEAEKLKQKLTTQGFNSVVIPVNNHSYNDLNKTQLGFLVRTGNFSTQEACQCI